MQRALFFTIGIGTAFIIADFITHPAPIGVATGIYFLANMRPSNRGRAICAAGIVSIAAFTAWGALIAACLIIATLLTELWLNNNIGIRLSRLALIAAAVKLSLLIAIPSVCTHLQALALYPSFSASAVGIAIFTEIVTRHKTPPVITTDPILAAFLATLIFAYAVTIALLSVNIDYPNAILLSAAGVSALLAVVGLLSAPFSHTASPHIVQQILSLKIPVEDWVSRISAIAAGHENAADFSQAVMEEFITLAGVTGVSWDDDNGNPQHTGKHSRYTMELQCPPLRLRLHMQRRASSWEWFNYYLLARIASEYWLGKRREERNRTHNLIRAVHETGARLTHDIKNILHTLVTLTSTKDDALLRRQLPHLQQRLASTLGKLQAPEIAPPSATASAEQWWREAQQRHAQQRVSFCGTANGELPTALFDLAIDNFISNALAKRQTTPAFNIKVSLSNIGNGVCLRVTDNGPAVPTTLVSALFVSPVESQNGFGVALYQIGVEAAKRHYSAQLSDNTDGCVTFQIAPAAQ